MHYSAKYDSTKNGGVTMPTDYHVAQKVIHWLMSLIIMLDLVVAQKFGDLMEGWDRLESRSDHATLGTIVTILFVLRIVLRLRFGAPPLPDSMTPWQRRLAKVAHLAMYFAIGALIVTGLITASQAASPVTLFGTFDITTGQADESLFADLRVFHEFMTNAVIALIVLHVAAAGYHQLFLRDRVLINMLVFWRRIPAQEKGEG